MNLAELYEYKAKYERELILAEAKVSVVNDMISDAVKSQSAEEVEEKSEEYEEPVNNY